MIYDVVTFGDNGGHGLREFLDSHERIMFLAGMGRHYAQLKQAGQGKCLVVDATDTKQKAEENGFEFLLQDYAAEGYKFPEAEIVLLWYCTSSLPSKEHARRVIRSAIAAAKSHVWLLFPNFQNEAGVLHSEYTLTQQGLRFAWTTWPEFTSKMVLKEYLQIVRDWSNDNASVPMLMNSKPASFIESVSSEQVVPITAPPEARLHVDSLYGQKKPYKISIPLVSSLELVVSKR